MSLADTRYAEAFVNVAYEKNALDVYQDELLSVSEILQNEDALKIFLFNPENTLTARKNVLSALFKDRVSQDVLNLLLLLLDKGRLMSLPGIYREYLRLADDKRNILNINIFTAVPLDQIQIENICRKFRSLYNAERSKAKVEIDPSLIGGVKVAIGDKLYDGSVKAKLAGLQSILT